MKRIILLILIALFFCGCTVNINLNDKKESDAADSNEQLNEDTNLENQANDDNTEQVKEKTVSENKAASLTPNYNFKSASASSQLADQGKYNYSPYNVIDGDVKTAWVEGVVGTGESEWIQLSSDGLETIHKIGICNGYRQNNTVFSQNGKVNTAMLEFSDGSSMTVDFDTVDEDGFTYFNIGETETSYVRITLLSCESGSKYDDTCISEIRIY